jgi:hypothetical protein
MFAGNQYRSELFPAEKKNSHYEDLKPTRTNMANELKAINTNVQ